MVQKKILIAIRLREEGTHCKQVLAYSKADILPFVVDISVPAEVESVFCDDDAIATYHSLSRYLWTHLDARYR